MRIGIDARRVGATAMRVAATMAATAPLWALPVMTTGAAAQTGPTLRPAAAPAGPEAVPGEIVVGFRPGVDGSERAAARSAADVRAERNLLVRRTQLVRVERGQTVDEAIAALERRPDVRYAEPNWLYHADSTTPDDPLFGQLWGLHNTGQAVNGGAAGTADADIDAPEAWDRSTGSASTVVAVVDGGVAWDHPDLAPNIWSNAGEIAGNGEDDDGNGLIDDVRGWDFSDDDNDPWDLSDHGTHVAGTIAARGNNGVGVTGVAWQASIMPLRALNDVGSGSGADIADAFTYAAANGARVVNASFSGPGFSQAEADAITGHPNTLFVVAAGNRGENNDIAPRFPCSFPFANLICVAATDNTDALASFSSFGALTVDLAAPGVDIHSAWPHWTDSFSDMFQSGLGAWAVESGPWGTVNVLGSTWLTDSPSSNYADNADWAIRTTSKVDVGTRTDCALRFRYGTFLQAGADWLDVQSSADGTTWTDMSRIGDTNGAVQDAFIALDAGSRFYRFRLTSDAGTNRNGVFIDDVRIGCPGGTYGSSDYQFLDGTSMATPQVAGAAAVLLSDTPAATVAEVKAALLDSGDPVATLSGKTVTGRRLNLNAALTALFHKANTTTTITSHDPDQSSVGQAVTVRYSVTGDGTGTGGGTPTGNVTVTDGTHSCTGTVAAGQCTITFLTAGSKSLTATYAGNANHNASPASASVSHFVDGADTTTTITSDAPDPSIGGQEVTVSFSVAVPAGKPTGTVTVSDGADSCTGTVAAGFCNVTLTTAGERALTASYAGDSNFESSTSAGEPHTVVRFATTTAITSAAPDPSVVGQEVTVSFSVATVEPTGEAPTGIVVVSDGVDTCTAAVAEGFCNIRMTTAGERSLTASYLGDPAFVRSTSAEEPHTVDRLASTSTIIAHDPHPSVVGQPVTVHYDVTADPPDGSTPTGDVTVTDGSNFCTGAVADGECTITFTTAGSKSLTASYAGDDNYSPSDSTAAPHTVNRADTTSTITSDNPDPSVVGQAVSVQYSVTPNAPGAGTPTGNVTVSDGSRSCTGTVAAGQCSITLTAAGSRSLTATYASDANYNASPASTSVTHEVNRAATTSTITSDNPDPSVVGQAVTVNYSVAANAPGSGIATGSVTVSDGTRSCTGTVADSECKITFTTAGSKSLTASYAGDDDYSPSDSTAEPHTVNRAGTSTAISADTPDPSVVGQPVVVRYSVIAPAPGAGTPTGEVRVSDGVDSCAASVAAGQCTIALTTAGSRTLTAAYAGDDNFRASSSSGMAHTVSPQSGSGGEPPPVDPPPSNTGGAPPTVAPPSTPLAHVSDASQTNPRFRVSARRQLVQVSRQRAPVGTTFKYTLDIAATVRFDFTKPGAGRRVNDKCVSTNRRNRRKPRCALQRGSLTFAGHAGVNTVRFKGWLSRTKKLTPGRHELTITAFTPGVGDTSQQLRFTVVR